MVRVILRVYMTSMGKVLLFGTATNCTDVNLNVAPDPSTIRTLSLFEQYFKPGTLLPPEIFHAARTTFGCDKMAMPEPIAGPSMMTTPTLQATSYGASSCWPYGAATALVVPSAPNTALSIYASCSVAPAMLVHASGLRVLAATSV